MLKKRNTSNLLPVSPPSRAASQKVVLAKADAAVLASIKGRAADVSLATKTVDWGAEAGCLARGENIRVIKLCTIQRIAVQINGDLITFLKQPDWSANSSFLPNMANYQTD